MTRILVAALCLLALTIALPGPAADASPTWKWTDATGVPDLGRVSFAHQHDGVGYVVAGKDRLQLWSVTLDARKPVWTELAAPPTAISRRARWTASKGTLVATGGEEDDKPWVFCARFDKGAWTTLPDLPQGRLLHTATLLRDGSVLVVGGRIAHKADVKGFDAKETGSALRLPLGAKAWQGAPTLPDARWLHTATLLPDDTVLVVGGSNEAVENGPSEDLGLPTTWRLDAAGKAWSAAAKLPSPRYGHEATLTKAGVVITGGEIDGVGSSTDDVAVFSTQKSSWRALRRAPYAPSSHAVSVLSDGRLLVTGGTDVFTDGAMPFSLDGAYVVDASRGKYTKVRKMPVGRSGHWTLVGKHGALVLGGSSLPFIPDPDHYDKPWTDTPPRFLRFK
jgi:hypothetical protein